MVCGMTVNQVLWFFITYAFLGWVVEVAFYAVSEGRVVNRGFLNGPICPVYGWGVIVVLAVLHIAGGIFGIDTDIGTANVIVLFFIGMVFATLTELIAGFLLDRLFHARWWDYGNRKFNLHGYICLEFSIAWGLVIAFVLRVVHPGVENIVNSIPVRLSSVWLAIIYIGFGTDTVITVLTILKFNKELERMQRMQNAILRFSDGMSEVIGNGTIMAVDKIGTELGKAAVKKDEIKEAFGIKKEEIKGTIEGKKEELQARRAELVEKLEQMKAELRSHPVFGTGRILRVFPDMKHRLYQQVLDIMHQEENGTDQAEETKMIVSEKPK